MYCDGLWSFFTVNFLLIKNFDTGRQKYNRQPITLNIAI